MCQRLFRKGATRERCSDSPLLQPRSGLPTRFCPAARLIRLLKAGTLGSLFLSSCFESEGRKALLESRFRCFPESCRLRPIGASPASLSLFFFGHGRGSLSRGRRRDKTAERERERDSIPGIANLAKEVAGAVAAALRGVKIRFPRGSRGSLPPRGGKRCRNGSTLGEDKWARQTL
ncbi:Hypothetical predicted protein [Podarcis lilfordi]|uniref:Uncharacterized protein n=1 Tax=Podarcis lilfordi TaxID=74358 RepID=A0AA35KYZ1_9SAUR|nr:Hypothetical predicted protein [Podarcis lilfordi]